MKWMKQFGIILLISFVGEILEKWIPLPIPASIYGIILLFLCLKLNIIPHEAVHETGKFLIEIMPLMFIPAAVGLLETWDVIAPAWLEYVAVTVISTWVVMIVSGRVTQFVIRRKRKDVQESHVCVFREFRLFWRCNQCSFLRHRDAAEEKV